VISGRTRVYIIAEAGVNHNGSVDLGRRLIDAAAEAGADAVKFQTFRAESLVSGAAPKADYQKQATGTVETQLQMLKKLELDEAAHQALAAHCRVRGIQFLSTPFDEESIDLLDKRIGVPLIKVPSGEVTNGPFLLAVARTGRPIILSTGMSTLDEVREALAVIAFGYTERKRRPSRAAFRSAFRSPAGRRALKAKVTLLHCTTEYPAPYSDVNLRAMDTLADEFGLAVGFSDHTPGMIIPVAAAARGASVIEKHFTLDRDLPGPDHKASLEPRELRAMVRAIRDVEQAVGTGEKVPAASEKKNIAVARRSIVAARGIRKGETFTPENIACKRPGTGASPMRYWDLLGTKAVKGYRKDEVIKP
jgi:N-acetylneuraminate synthase